MKQKCICVCEKNTHMELGTNLMTQTAMNSGVGVTHGHCLQHFLSFSFTCSLHATQRHHGWRSSFSTTARAFSVRALTISTVANPCWWGQQCPPSTDPQTTTRQIPSFVSKKKSTRARAHTRTHARTHARMHAHTQTHAHTRTFISRLGNEARNEKSNACWKHGQYILV